ncbi:uncharacterized protein LOC129965511 [Argiope bruennichi]|uniref:uncharacterized protein LOC129965511 n=1 Tax=Argiope bruennichi TaxID=94029 RepID=UPI0024945834|nr:uncharacterized protein LOC129965511 [Argiope bruennichi]XP_055935453.1 uncharacterized protein LOC129965511 [Argiope bruennichi]
MAHIDFEEYRAPWETGPHWELKREFMEKYQNDYSLDRLLCLAQAYSNIELLHCSYPEPVMREVYQLSCQLKGCKRFREAEADLERRRKEKLEMQPKKVGKRTLSDEISVKPYKFIKFCSPNEVTDVSKLSNDYDKTSNENINCDTRASNDSRTSADPKDSNKNTVSVNTDSNGTALLKDNSNAIFLISHSPDFGLIQKIATAIPKKSKSPLESMESAIEVSGLENAVKYVFLQDDSVICCQFYIGNTLVATGRDTTEKYAKEKAVHYGVEILINLSHLPCKTLEDLKEELQNWIKATNSMLLWSEISLDLKSKSKQLMSQLLEMEKNPMYADLHFILEIVQKLFYVKFRTEMCKQKTKVPASRMIQEAAAKLKCDLDVYFFHFGEDPDSLLNQRAFYCDFVIKNIFICQSKSSSKKKAKNDASEKGLNLLTNFIENCIFQKQQNDQTQVKSLKRNFESSNGFVTDMNTDETINYYFSKGNSSSRDKEYLSNNKKSESKKLFHKKPKTENYLKSLVAENLSSVPSSEWNHQDNSGSKSKLKSFRINHRLLTNSRNQQLIVFDLGENSYKNSAGHILFITANKCKKIVRHEVEEIPVDGSGNSAKMFRYSITLEGEEIGKALALAEKEAKAAAIENAVQFLQNHFYTIKMKNEIEKSFIISRSHILNAENPSSVLSESNIGCKMLKSMGWTGGGIGKTSGIIEPIVATDHKFGHGLGFSENKAQEKSFKQKIEALLKDFSQSNTTSDLIFSTEFNKEERKEIHKLATRYNLINNSRGKGEQRQLFIGKKFSPMELLERLIEAGGSTPKYELEDRSVSGNTSVSLNDSLMIQ